MENDFHHDLWGTEPRQWPLFRLERKAKESFGAAVCQD